MKFGVECKPLPDNFDEVRVAWRNRGMNLKDAAKLYGMASTTFYDAVRRAAERGLRERDKALAQKKAVLAQSEKRIAELDVIFKRIHEDNISGKLSDDRFIKLSRDYEQEQLKAILETLGREVQQEQKKTNVRKFISVVKKYTDMTQLDAVILREFVEQIRVPTRPMNSRSG